jgi:RNA polymerase sigma-70 factor (ECF subfamily)
MASPSHSKVLAAGRPANDVDHPADGPTGEDDAVDARARTRPAPSPDLEGIYRAHADDVATWARRLGGPDLDVEDIVHEVFLVVQRRLPEWRGEAKITTWLYEITLRVVSDRRRRWWRWPLRATARTGARDELGRIAASEPDALALLERREATRTLYRLLDGIGEKYRTVIVLYELEGKSGDEIATLTHTSLANVWIRLHRGRRKLLERFLAWEAKGRP